VDLRIGVTQSPREMTLELDDDTDREALQRQINDALVANDDKVLWFTDKRGRKVGVPVGKVAYIEISADEQSQRFGFGS
jgi:sugar lactone lactonase YvrE